MSAEHLTLEASMSAFASSFHSLGNAPGVKLWDANTLDRWAAETPLSHGERVTAQFLLAVWDPNHSWACGKFDLMEALRIWDNDHHAAFLTWVKEPWWP
jgi:hypothetical protein